MNRSEQTGSKINYNARLTRWFDIVSRMCNGSVKFRVPRHFWKNLMALSFMYISTDFNKTLKGNDDI